MAQVLEQDAAAEAITATVNYIVDNGEKIFTETGAPGATDRRNGGTPDLRQVTIRNGRPEAERFELDRDGFRFVRHDTKVADFFDEDEIRRVYHPEMEALIKAESGASRVVVFDHTLRTAGGAPPTPRRAKRARSARSCAAPTTTTRNGRVRSGCAISCRRRPTICFAVASPSSRCGGRSGAPSRPFRWRSAMPAASRSRIS